MVESATKFQNLSQALIGLQTERDRLIELLRRFDKEQLNRSPEIGVWSPMEVLHHIIISEEGSLKYVKKKLSFNPVLPRTSLISTLRYQVLIGAIHSPFHFKAPSEVVPQSKEYDLESLENHWQKVAGELHNYLVDIEPRLLDYQVYKHPLAGRLSIVQMVGFLKHHLLRHKKQIVSRLPSVS